MNFNREAGAIVPFLKLVGLWPEGDRKQIVLFFIHLIMQVNAVATISMSILFEESTPKAIDKIFGWAGIMVPLSSMIIFRLHFHKIRSIIEIVRCNWDEFHFLPSNLQVIMEKNGTHVRRATTCIFAIFGLSLIFFCLQPLLLHWVFPSKFAKGIPHDPWYPFDLRSSPIFEIMYIIQSMCYCSTVMIFATVDCCIIWLIFHCIGQLEVLRVTLTKYVGTVHHVSASVEQQTKINSKACNCLSCIVDFQYNISSTILLFDDSFHIVMFARMILCSMHFVCIGHIVIEMKKEGNFGFLMIHLIFLITMNSTLLIYCYAGDKLKMKSMDIANAAFNCQSFEKPAMRRDLMMIIRQMQTQPLRISGAKFFVLSLELFKEYLLKSVSYLSVLAAVSVNHDI